MEAPPCKVTVLYPCLNEEEAIGRCVDEALAAIAAAGLSGEVLVIDNASTDRSPQIAAEHGARVVTETHRGYGNAYLRGLREARGAHIVMLDADIKTVEIPIPYRSRIGESKLARVRDACAMSST